MSKDKKGEYGEAVNEKGYDVLKDHKRALRQTGQGLHPSVLTKAEQKIVAKYDADRAKKPSSRQATSDGYMVKKPPATKLTKSDKKFNKNIFHE